MQKPGLGTSCLGIRVWGSCQNASLCSLSLMFSLSLCLCVCLCFFLSRVCSVSLFITLSLPKIYWAETQNWKGKGTFSCQGWEMCSWHSKQNLERIYFFIETLMKMVIENHQVDRVSVKQPALRPGGPQGPGFTMYRLCALGQITQHIWALLPFDMKFFWELNQWDSIKTKL